MNNCGGFKKLSLLLVGMAFVLLLAACGGQETSNESEDVAEGTAGETTDAESSADTEPVKIVLNWFAKAQHGGVYAAQDQGMFEENGLDIEIEPGGPQVSSIQMVASGSAEFGLAHADQLVIARNQGIELVAVAAAMQGSPQALMFHEGKGIDDFEELDGRTTYIQPGITYWDFLKNEYDLGAVEELAYTGQHVNFIDDPDAVSQAFVTSEPFFLEQEGIATETKLISDAGYDPYNIVLYVAKDYLAENEDTVENFVTAFVDGWDYYKESPDDITRLIQESNTDIAYEALQFEQETQEEFIYEGDAAEYGVGYMSEERWTKLIDQLYELELLDEKFDATDIFTTEYLPEN